MNESRRRFLTQLAAVSAASTSGSTGCRTPAPPLLAAGPMVAEPTAHAAVLWARTAGPRTLRPVSAAGPLAPFRRTREDDGHTVTFPLEGLSPGMRETFWFEEEGSSARSQSGTLATAPRGRTRIALGADLLAAYRPFLVLPALQRAAPDLLLLAGDTIYADRPRGHEARDLDGYRAKHREVRDDPALASLLRRTPVVATWDDHDIDQNADRTSPRFAMARKAFLEHWPVRARGPDTGLYRCFGWGPLADVFMLDTRSFRGPRSEGGQHLGAAQMARLEADLLASRAPFKLVVSSVSMLDPFGLDSWRAYPAELERFRAFVRTRGIRTVLVLSADLHLGWDLEERDAGLREFVVGPLAAWPLTHFGSARLPKIRELGRFHLADRLQFLSVDLDPTPTGARAVVAWVDEHGTRHGEVVVDA